MYVIIHHVPGRLRLKGVSLKRNEPEARRISILLTHCEGVRGCQVNTLTGSVVIHYDTTLNALQTILAALRQPRMIETPADRLPPLSPARAISMGAPTPDSIGARSPGRLTHLSAALGKRVLEMAVEKLVERSIFALVRVFV